MASKSEKTGRVMVFAAWILVAILLTYLFQGVLSRHWNPNEQLGAVEPGAVQEPVMLRRNRVGQYVAPGKINGAPAEFLIDTGATYVSLPASLAGRLNLERGVPLNAVTANGTVTTYKTVLDRVELGGIQMRNVPAVINPSMGDDIVLLGMSFLKHLKMSQQGNHLVLAIP
jgi:aspartyl protease family protein